MEDETKYFQAKTEELFQKAEKMETKRENFGQKLQKSKTEQKSNMDILKELNNQQLRMENQMRRVKHKSVYILNDLKIFLILRDLEQKRAKVRTIAQKEEQDAKVRPI